MIAAQARLEAASIELKAAEADAAAMLAQAEAARQVVEAETTAAAEVLAQEAGVYADERDYVRAKLYAKTAPRLRSVLVGDEKDGVFGLPVRRAPGTGAPPGPVSAAPRKNGGAK